VANDPQDQNVANESKDSQENNFIRYGLDAVEGDESVKGSYQDLLNLLNNNNNDGDRPKGSWKHNDNLCHCVGCIKCKFENGRCQRPKVHKTSGKTEYRDQCKQCSRIPRHQKAINMTPHPNVVIKRRRRRSRQQSPHHQWNIPIPRRKSPAVPPTNQLIQLNREQGVNSQGVNSLGSVGNVLTAPPRNQLIQLNRSQGVNSLGSVGNVLTAPPRNQLIQLNRAQGVNSLGSVGNVLTAPPRNQLIQLNRAQGVNSLGSAGEKPPDSVDNLLNQLYSNNQNRGSHTLNDFEDLFGRI
jgi:hypothetical protein